MSTFGTEMRETPLDLASGSGKLDVVRFLIERGANIHTKDNEGWNPLHIASQNGHLDVVRMLINAGIAIDIRNGTQRPRWPWRPAKGSRSWALPRRARGRH
jgi:hypothetical protein